MCLVYEKNNEEKMKSSRFIFTIDFCCVTICCKEKFDDDDDIRDKRTHERRRKKRISTFVSFNSIRSRKRRRTLCVVRFRADKMSLEWIDLVDDVTGVSS